jgi:hypothetical protein
MLIRKLFKISTTYANICSGIMAEEDRADSFLGIVLIGSYFGEMVMEEKEMC